MRTTGVIRRQWPWSFEAGLRWIVSSMVALLLILVAWYIVSGEGKLESQVPLVAGSVAALMVGCYGHVAMVARGRRLVGQRRVRLLSDALVTDNRDTAVSHRAMADVGDFEAVGALIHFHVATCPMLVGRPVEEIFVGTFADHLHDGRQPCGICHPARPTSGVHAAEGDEA